MDKNRPVSPVQLITERECDELLQLFFNIVISCINAIILNESMHNSLLDALGVNDLADGLNKGVFSTDYDKTEAIAECIDRVSNNESTSSGLDTKSNDGQIEKQRNLKVCEHPLSSNAIVRAQVCSKQHTLRLPNSVNRDILFKLMSVKIYHVVCTIQWNQTIIIHLSIILRMTALQNCM